MILACLMNKETRRKKVKFLFKVLYFIRLFTELMNTCFNVETHFLFYVQRWWSILITFKIYLTASPATSRFSCVHFFCIRVSSFTWSHIFSASYNLVMDSAPHNISWATVGSHNSVTYFDTTCTCLQQNQIPRKRHNMYHIHKIQHWK